MICRCVTEGSRPMGSQGRSVAGGADSCPGGPSVPQGAHRPQGQESSEGGGDEGLGSSRRPPERRPTAEKSGCGAGGRGLGKAGCWNPGPWMSAEEGGGSELHVCQGAPRGLPLFLTPRVRGGLVPTPQPSRCRQRLEGESGKGPKCEVEPSERCSQGREPP